VARNVNPKKNQEEKLNKSIKESIPLGIQNIIVIKPCKETR
jgi:hypothetical protein